MGPGLTSDRNFQSSVEMFRKGDNFRRIVYGKTREEVVAELERTFSAAPSLAEWQDMFVVMPTKRIAMGLGPAWARVTRRSDEYGEKV